MRQLFLLTQCGVFNYYFFTFFKQYSYKYVVGINLFCKSNEMDCIHIPDNFYDGANSTRSNERMQ